MRIDALYSVRSTGLLARWGTALFVSAVVAFGAARLAGGFARGDAEPGASIGSDVMIALDRVLRP
jgi:hypothetical protein